MESPHSPTTGAVFVRHSPWLLTAILSCVLPAREVSLASNHTQQALFVHVSRAVGRDSGVGLIAFQIPGSEKTLKPVVQAC